MPDDALFLLDAAGKSTIDIRTDLPRYNIYESGVLIQGGITDVTAFWTSDSVAFLIGCSFSFETALANADLVPRHVEMGRNVPMYRTKIPLCPAGVFTGSTMVVSMRPYRRKDIERVRDITREFGVTHGEPVDWGWGALERLGIDDIDIVTFGDNPLTKDGRPLGEARKQLSKGAEGCADLTAEEEIPMFWGCGVTPQEVVMRAGSKILATVIGHMPGHMLVMDVKDDRVKV